MYRYVCMCCILYDCVSEMYRVCVDHLQLSLDSCVRFWYCILVCWNALCASAHTGQQIISLPLFIANTCMQYVPGM